eukprot:Blabericola_migrator_1__1949@NODE_152_length_12797_cov_95_608720_g133_i0_p8_GENE_NODE_152_length_12797_cov_95_608720_g133_i0NODE_152_length_12797_cov_95_608720_g133_i0_p8_ORF_typecomplete_len155_score32_34_NODE_152_length_12797_cov_95_608720_g133_i05511015
MSAIKDRTALLLDLASLLSEFENEFLPELLVALNDADLEINKRFLESHCTESALGALKAAKNPAATSPEMNKLAPLRTAFSRVVKVEWKGCHSASVSEDERDGLLLFLVTLREVADGVPCEVNLSMAVTTARRNGGLKFVVREVVLLSSETFLV